MYTSGTHWIIIFVVLLAMSAMIIPSIILYIQSKKYSDIAIESESRLEANPEASKKANNYYTTAFALFLIGMFGVPAGLYPLLRWLAIQNKW
jgi:formate hydrogenlyase subunit 3/multisubunit Na+/H+ antiporter MnhD subunit